MPLAQIIKEKLAFPSGTATAQLISVLYKTPLRIDVLPGPAPRAQTRIAEDTERLLQPEGRDRFGTGEHCASERVLEGEGLAVKRIGKRENGWIPLAWSFGAAASITVCMLFLSPSSSFSQSPDSCVLFPSRVCYSVVWCIPGTRMVVVFHA
jgi:uncharacterized oligopeptide transporter (OPT) family protein